MKSSNLIINCMLGILILSSLLLYGCEKHSTDWTTQQNAQLKIWPENPIAISGSYLQLSAILTYENGTTQDVTDSATWMILTGGLGSISNSGMFHSYSGGAGYIVADYQGTSDTTTVQIVRLLQLMIDPPTVYLPPGAQFAFHCNALVDHNGNWTDTIDCTNQIVFLSQNPDIATIDVQGTMTANTFGTTLIRASLGSEWDDGECNVRELDSVTVQPPSGLTLTLGDSTQLSATAHFGSHSQLVTPYCTWQSNNPTVMDFTAAGQPGLIISQSAGEASIHAVYNSTPSASILLYARTLASIAITPSSATTDNFLPIQFHATGVFDNGSFSDVTNTVAWSSSITNVAIISTTGLAMPTGSGTCNVLAQKNGVISNIAELQVNSDLWYENFDNGVVHSWIQNGSWECLDSELVSRVLYGVNNECHNIDMEFGDFTLQIDCQDTSTGGYFFGNRIVFRLSVNLENYYYISIVPQDKLYRMGYYGYYESYDLAYGYSDAIMNGPDAWNTLKIEAYGDEITLSINDTYVTKVTNAQLQRGYIGIQNAGYDFGQEYRYDNLEVQLPSGQTQRQHQSEADPVSNNMKITPHPIIWTGR